MKLAAALICVAACATSGGPASPGGQRSSSGADVSPTAASPGSRPATLTPAVVLSTIRSRYLSGVRRCYRTHLKYDATARGQVLVSFTVDPSGQARDGEARGITDRVDDCIAAQVARWQFPSPARESRFALRLELDTD